MLLTEPLSLHHSWPIFERGLCLSDGMMDVGRSSGLDEDGPSSCDLITNRLRWFDSAFRPFGLPPGVTPARDVVLPLYRPDSRAALERLRSHAIRHRRGFTIDVAVYPLGQLRRWLPIVAVAEVEKGRSVRLRGVHQDVTHEYR